MGAGVKHRVATTDISPDGMGLPQPVPDGDLVTVAGATTGQVVFALGQKSREDTVFHMKHGDVLVEGEFEPSGWSRPKKFKELGDIEIVAGREKLKTFGNEEIGRKGIGNVEGKVADHGKFGGAEVVERTKVPDEDSIRFCTFDQTKKPGLTGFLDSRSG